MMWIELAPTRAGSTVNVASTEPTLVEPENGRAKASVAGTVDTSTPVIARTATPATVSPRTLRSALPARAVSSARCLRFSHPSATMSAATATFAIRSRP